VSGWRDFTELKLTLRRLSSTTSLNILHQLAGQGEITVTDLVSALAISQPLVSWHLRNLRRVGLVRTRRHGREVYCSLDAAQFAALVRTLSEVAIPDAGAQVPSGPEPARRGPPVGASPPPSPGENTPGRPHARAGPATS
jgi:ArsR family transcriptional regulator, arsenate/arsenite/antimonite-responsive transcriptional repressor